MIYCLTGKIIKKTLNAVVLSCGGVGYFAQCPASVAGALPGVGKDATIYTVMSVTENDVSLYGFATEEQQACFEMLTAVSGVGPKVGLAILSVMEPDRVALAISCTVSCTASRFCSLARRARRISRIAEACFSVKQSFEASFFDFCVLKVILSVSP